MTVIDILLKNRGLSTKAAIQEFFHPIQPDSIKFSEVGLDPKAMRQAVAVIKQAIARQLPIFIYGDYDADGICSTAVLWESLFHLKAKVLPFFGGRDDPVRGLSVTGLKAIGGPALVITVDNGITSFAAAEYAAKNKLDLIITDHHLPNGNRLPRAAAIVHSTQLAGVGVAWFLARELGGNGLDLAAMATIADMVPLLKANRSLVSFGLKKLRATQRPGIQLLATRAKLDLKQLTPHQVSFSLAPRLNALGRMGSSLDALRLLCVKDKIRAEALAENMDQIHQERQEKTASMFIDAKAQAVKIKDKKIIFVQSETYHEGLVGLVAGRLVEEYNRPAVAVAIGPNHAKGSIRSLLGFNAIETLRNMTDLLLEQGGHPLAAGFTANPENLTKIMERLEAAADLSAAVLAPEPDYECELSLDKVNWQFFNELEKFEPFGFSNPVPVFLAKKVKINSFYPVGQEGKHLKLKINNFNAIAFGKGALAAKLKPGQLVDITYSLEANHWNGQKSLELKVKEIKV